MVNGFDFNFSPDGEIIVNSETHDINKVTNDELRIQLAYNRIKSISYNWFIDEIGANLEELIGKPCTKEIANLGKTKIINVLTVDNLWDEKDIFVKVKIENNTNIIYSTYLKIYQTENEDAHSYEIIAELDLVKGVFIRYGWEPRR